MAAMINGPKADGEAYTFNFEFTDLDEVHVLQLENAVLHHRMGEPATDANATIRMTHELFIRMLTRQAGVREILFSDEVGLEGSGVDFIQFFTLMEPPNEAFDIVTP